MPLLTFAGRPALERRVRTIDGFAQAILRAGAGSLGVAPNFGLLVLREFWSLW